VSIVRRLVTAAAALMTATPVLGHVFWIQPSSFSPATGQVIGVQLRVGDNFPGESLPRDDQRIVHFVSLGPSFPGGDARPVMGRPGRDPAGMVRFTAPGVHVLAYQSSPTPVNLVAEKFETYLREQGLEKVSRARHESGLAGADAKEIFSRSVKSLVSVNAQHGAGFDSIAGLRFEIIPLQDPTALKAGQSLRLRLAFEKEPLADALIQVRSISHQGEVVSVRSDRHGEATITIPSAGSWLVDAVEMIPATTGSGADWESVWTSLTFATADAAPVAPASPVPLATGTRP
jgi:hypothetical protein